MNTFKVWVDILPAGCWECPCNSDDYACNLVNDDICYGENERREDCPLKLISEYAKEQENE